MILFLSMFLMADDTLWQLDLAALEIYRAEPFVLMIDDKTLAVADTDENRVLILSTDGTVKATFGRKGQGPGEFAGLGALFWNAKEQELYVADYTSRRFSTWSLDGKHLRDTKYPKANTYPINQIGPDIILAGFNGMLNEEKPNNVLRYSANGETTTEVWSRPLEKTYTMIEVKRGDQHFFFTPVWNPRFHAAFSEQSIAVALGFEDKVTVMNHEGKNTANIKVDMVRGEITDEIINEEFPYLKNEKRPEYWPMIQEIAMDSDDRTWVFGWGKDPMNGLPYQIFNRAGKKIAEGQVTEVPLTVTPWGYVKKQDENTGDEDTNIITLVGVTAK